MTALVRVIVAIAVLAPAAGAQTGARATLLFESEALALATGQLHPAGDDTGGDVRVAHHGDRATHAVVVPARPGVETAYLADVAWDGVDAGAVAGASFGVDVDDRPFEPGDTVLVRTPEGGVFKLGNASEGAETASFDYAPVE